MTSPRREGERGWDPLGELQALRAELGRLLGSAWVGGRGAGGAGGGGGADVDLTEIPDGWQVVVRLPGVAPEEVAVELDDRDLCVRARTEEEVNADYGLIGTGSRARGFEYRVTLPAPVDPDRADALMDHGLLTVILPRRDRATRRTITVAHGRYAPDESPGAGPRGAATAADPAADRELHQPDAMTANPDRAAK